MNRSLLPRKFPKHISMILFIALYLFAFNTLQVCADDAAKLNNSGIKAFEERDIEESVRQFTEALVERPDTPELLYNRGTALSAAGTVEDAVNELNRAAKASPSLQLAAAAHFNAGNAYLSAGEIENAVKEYMQAISIDQSATDYRKNLELALRQQQEQQQEQQQDDNGKSEQNKDQQENQDEQQQDESEQDNNQQTQDQSDQQQQQPQPNPQEQDEQPMSPEEAQQILDAMKDEEKQAFELKRMLIQESMRPGDDW